VKYRYVLGEKNNPCTGGQGKTTHSSSQIISLVRKEVVRDKYCFICQGQ